MPSHNDVEKANLWGTTFKSARFGTQRKVLDGNFTADIDGPAAHFLDPGGANRNVTLPALVEGGGTFIIVANAGTANTLIVLDNDAVELRRIDPGQALWFLSSEDEWASGPGLFGASGPNHAAGLVPDPGAVAGAVRFLREDGSWASVHVVGIVDSYKNITDGTNTAVASGPDTLKFRSSDTSLTVTVTSNDVTHGDNVNLVVNEPSVDHDLLLNYDVNKHVDHTAVSINTAANSGLAGGGTIAASRSLSIDINNLASATPVLADSFALYDASGLVTAKALLSDLNGILDHNALLNYSANRHIDHTAVSIIAGIGLSGGGTIDATRTLSIDFTEFETGEAITSSDLLPFYDVSESDHNTTTVALLNAALDHNILLNYVANQHIDHTTVSIDAGIGLTGGGTIAANRTIALNITGLGTVALASGDEFAFYDISGVTHGKATLSAINAALVLSSLSGYVANEHINHTSVTLTAGAGLTGGGDISASRSFAVGAGTGITVNADDVALDTTHSRNVDHTGVTLTAGAGLTGGGDISANRTFDVGAGVGITVNANDVALNINGLTADTLATGDFFAFYDISGSDHNKVTIADLNAFLSHNSLSGYVANEHINHTSVTLTAGNGLTGGGDISASRSFAVGAGTGITVNADDVALAAIADDRILANIAGSSAAPIANTLTAIIDACIGSTQGAILTRNATAWIQLAPGTATHVLTSGGAGANLSYAAVNAYATMTDGTTPASASGGDTFKFRAGTGLAVATQSNDGTHGDNVSYSLSHLGLEQLSDPGADRIMFWDDSEGLLKWLSLGTGLSLTTTTLAAVAASTTVAGVAENATAAEYRSKTTGNITLTPEQAWDAAAEVTLTDAATIAVDFSTFINAVVTLAGNRALGNPTNEKVGQSGIIRVVQDGTGGRTLSYGTDYEHASGTPPVLSTTGGDQDLLFYYILATDRVFLALIKDIS